MLTDTLTFDVSPLPPPTSFTYSHSGQSLFRRGLIRTVETQSGQPKLQRLYLDWAASGKRPGESVFDAALRLLNLRPQIDTAAVQAVPQNGGLLIVANHPFGIVDGLALGHLGMRLRGNVRIMTNSLLCKVPEIDPHLLPVDFSGTAEARSLTGETRRQATRLLAEGKVVAIFPAGNVATANRPFQGRAVDTEWHPFVGRLATLPGVTTLPVHFAGQNSRLFQIASHWSYPLRVALIFHATRRKMGCRIKLRIGVPISSDSLQQLDRADVARTLRWLTVALGAPPAADLDEVYVWPRRVRW